MKTIILAGGFGTRLAEETSLVPKPMVEVGGRPVLWHIMHIYASYGYKEFVVALGYKGEAIKRYYLNYHYLQNNISIQLNSGHVEIHDGGKLEDWLVHFIDTGLHTQTGGRIKRLSSWVRNNTFMMTYGDGVANVDIGKLLVFHKKHGKLATVTAVRPPARFGEMSFNNDLVDRFVEKSQIGEGWINGGFFVLEPGVIDYITDDATSFEYDPLRKLAEDGQLVAYRHDGFWQCMDTLRDVQLLNKLWDTGQASWKLW